MKSTLPRRILMTADTIGGVWSYAMELCRSFEPFGIEVELATMGAPLNRTQREQAARCPAVQIFESRYKLEWMDSPWSEVAAAGDWLLDLDKRTCPDLVHLNGYAHGSLPWRVPTVVVGHSCVLSWWRAVRGTEAPAEWDHYRNVVRNGLQAADLVIAPSHAMLGALQEHYGPLDKINVIPNGRSIGSNRSRGKEKFILSAGRLWDDAKNLSALTSIAPRLPWPVCVAGEEKSPAVAAADSELPGASLRLNARSLGRLAPAELANWLSRAAIYAAPARYEPFGLSILEAALAGCALVLGDIPSLREIWVDAAIYVPPEDHDALQEALENLISNERLRVELGNKASRRAASFTPERMTNHYLAAYSELLQADSEETSPQEVACVL